MAKAVATHAAVAAVGGGTLNSAAQAVHAVGRGAGVGGGGGVERITGFSNVFFLIHGTLNKAEHRTQHAASRALTQTVHLIVHDWREVGPLARCSLQEARLC